MPKPKKNESKQDFLGRCTRELIDKEGKEADEAYAVCNAYWDETKGTRNSLSLTAPFVLKKGESETDEGEIKSFMITAYTGNVIDLGWWGKFVFDVKGMKAKEKFPVLREHVRERIVGIANRTWKDDKNFYIGGDFSDATPDGSEVLDLAKEGFPWQASVGIWPKKIRSLKDEKESATVNGMEIIGPAEIWIESSVGEVSFVALGADDQTAAIVLSDKSVPVEIIEQPITKEVKKMTLEELKTKYPELIADIQDESRKLGFQDGRKEGEAAERARVAAILEADADPAVTKKAIMEGVSADGAFKLFYKAEKEKRATALKELETSAPEPMGATPPKEPPPANDPKKELMEKAKKLAKEKRISVAQALKELQAENPELMAASLPTMHLVVNE